MSGADDGKPRPAGAWCRERQLAVAINMGMYEQDERTNTGYARKDRLREQRPLGHEVPGGARLRSRPSPAPRRS